MIIVGAITAGGDQAPLKLFSGQFLLANVASCVQAVCVYVLPLFLVSRESMHSAPLPSTTRPPSVGQVGLSTALPPFSSPRRTLHHP